MVIAPSIAELQNFKNCDQVLEVYTLVHCISWPLLSYIGADHQGQLYYTHLEHVIVAGDKIIYLIAHVHL